MDSIVVFGSLASSLRNFRGPLLTSIQERNYVVHALAPDLLEDRETSEWLRAQGFISHSIPLSRAGMNPLGDLAALWALIVVLGKIRPRYYIGYTIKPVIWGLMSAWITRVPNRVALVTGLGYAFTGQATGKRALVRRLVRMLYRFSLSKSTLIFFQNPDDRDDFQQLRLLPSNVPTLVVNGSGVDVSEFSPAPFPSAPLRFLLIARLLGDKGIREYIAAASRLKERYADVQFHLVGPLDPNPDSIPESEAASWAGDKNVIWHGTLADVRPAISDCHVFVLPSYREGTPRTVLEAMSMGRPIVTTDAPGCRETVIDGENGFLVPVKAVDELVYAMERFIKQPQLIESMGYRSRQLVLEKYDVDDVNEQMLEAMRIACVEL